MASNQEEQTQSQDAINHERDHPIFQTDPAKYMQYVYKEVCVNTNDGASHSGWVYTIDPVSQSVVLVKFKDEDISTVEVVMGHMVRDIIITDGSCDTHKSKLDSLCGRESDIQLTPEELAKRRLRLKSWLLKNRMPVQECKDNIEVLNISDALYVQPPYGPDNCQSTNEIILGRIQGLIKNMPKDVDEW